MQRILRVAGAALFLVLFLGACGSKNEIGPNLSNDDGNVAACEGAVGGCTTTTPKPTTTTTSKAAATATTVRPVVTTATTVVKPSLEIIIHDDDKGPYYDPRTPDTYVNTIVRFTNAANNEHDYSVRGTYPDNSSAFVTRKLKPGQSEDIKLTRTGQIKLGDDLADYRVGYISVHPR